MCAWLRKWWRVGKILLAVAIVVAIGRRFVHDLQSPELWQRSLRYQWLVLSGGLYLWGLGFSAAYWYLLLHALGQRPSFLSAVRAHYIGQMGKYLPGKAWALVLRSNLVRGPGVRLGIAVLTSFYEVLATMAAGALLAAMLFALLAPDTSSAMDWQSFRHLLRLEEPENTLIDRKVAVLLAVLLLLPIGIPILPPIFNRIVHRIALPFRDADAAPLPRIRAPSMLQGLVLGSGCWLMMGASLWAALQAVMVTPPAWTWETWGHYTGFMALAYVAGFIILFIPSGIGVREVLLTLFLAPQITPLLSPGEGGARATAVLTALLLRLVWTTAELVMVGIFYLLRSSVVRSRRSAPSRNTERKSDSTPGTTDHGLRTTAP